MDLDHALDQLARDATASLDVAELALCLARDEYGGLDRAIEIAKQLANIPADKSIQRVIMPQPPTFLEQLMSASDDDSEADAQAKQQASLLSALPEDVREGFRYAQMLDRAAKGEPVYMMPFKLRIK